MPYLKFTSTDNKQIEIGGNKYDDFKTKLDNTANLAAVSQAIAYVKAFFDRRTLQVQRQKAVVAGDEREAERIDDLLDDAEETEDNAKEAYEQAVKSELSGQANNISLASASINGPASAAAGPTGSSSATVDGGAGAAGNAYGDIQPTEAANNNADDDFM